MLQHRLSFLGIIILPLFLTACGSLKYPSARQQVDRNPSSSVEQQVVESSPSTKQLLRKQAKIVCKGLTGPKLYTFYAYQEPYEKKGPIIGGACQNGRLLNPQEECFLKLKGRKEMNLCKTVDPKRRFCITPRVIPIKNEAGNRYFCQDNRVFPFEEPYISQYNALLNRVKGDRTIN